MERRFHAYYAHTAPRAPDGKAGSRATLSALPWQIKDY